MVDSTSSHQTGLAVWTRQAADSHGVMTINSQASYWWIAVNINRPGNKEEEEGEEGRGGEGEATMGYIAGDNNNNIRTRQRLQLDYKPHNS